MKVETKRRKTPAPVAKPPAADMNLEREPYQPVQNLHDSWGRDFTLMRGNARHMLLEIHNELMLAESSNDEEKHVIKKARADTHVNLSNLMMKLYAFHPEWQMAPDAEADGPLTEEELEMVQRYLEKHYGGVKEKD